MATLQELLDIEGVVAAGEFSLDGSMLDYAAEMDISEEMEQMIASSFTNQSGMNWVPQHAWVYSGGEWTACIGDAGKQGVLVETSKADFNKVFEALGDER